MNNHKLKKFKVQKYFVDITNGAPLTYFIANKEGITAFQMLGFQKTIPFDIKYWTGLEAQEKLENAQRLGGCPEITLDELAWDMENWMLFREHFEEGDNNV